MDGRVSDAAYLSTRYVDGPRGLVIERHYRESGDVIVVRDGEPELRCRFDGGQIAAAKQAIIESGLLDVDDIAVGDRHDTATMTYRWELETASGEVVDHAYPVVVPAAFDTLEAALTELEDASRLGR